MHAGLGGESFLTQVGAQPCAPQVGGETRQRCSKLGVWSWSQGAIVQACSRSGNRHNGTPVATTAQSVCESARLPGIH